jgi:5-methylcytosine-specific restriction endonuclease McrA
MTRFSLQYVSYITSDAWRTRRKRALQRAGYRCQLCGEAFAPRSGRLQVHHNSYENLGNERDEDLTVLCVYCHLVATWAIRARRAWRWLVGKAMKLSS